MFDLDSKSDAQWRERVEQINEEHTDKLAQLQKQLDKSSYEEQQCRRELNQMSGILTHVLRYFLVERNLPMPKKDLDVFYLKDIIEQFHEGSVNDQEEV
jgi:hypothetical protein